jgi:hypothetical protein
MKLPRLAALHWKNFLAQIGVYLGWSRLRRDNGGPSPMPTMFATIR